MPVHYPGRVSYQNLEMLFCQGGGGGGTSGRRDLEKGPGTKARTTNKLYSHPLPESNRGHWWQW